MPALAKSVEIAADDQAELDRIVRSSTAEVRMVERAQIVLCAAEGRSAAEIGRLVGCSTNTAQKWRARYEQDGIAGLRDLPRSGKPLIYSQADRARLIAKACTRPPETPEGAQQERWTYEQLGQAVGMSRAQAHTILARADIKPHLTDYWVMSDFSDPEFEERLKGVCGLYVKSARERAGRLDRRKDRDPGQGTNQARHPSCSWANDTSRARIHPQRHAVPVRVSEGPRG